MPEDTTSILQILVLGTLFTAVIVGYEFARNQFKLKNFSEWYYIISYLPIINAIRIEWPILVNQYDADAIIWIHESRYLPALITALFFWGVPFIIGYFFGKIIPKTTEQSH